MAQFSDLLDKGVNFIPFDPPYASPALTPQDIARWETIINAQFPKQYREYLLHCNGGEMRISKNHKESVDCYAFTIKWKPEMQGLTPGSLLGQFFMIQDIPTGKPHFTMTFDYNYNCWKDFLPSDTFPIATDPGGNLILIGLKGESAGKIYYWLFETANAVETPETAAYVYLGEIADSFADFILSLKYIKNA